MNFISVLSCLSLLLAAAVAQAPKPCVSPLQMSGGFTVMAGNGLLSSAGTIKYDALGQRMRVKSSGFIGNHTFTMDQLMLFKQAAFSVPHSLHYMDIHGARMDLNIVRRTPNDTKVIWKVYYEIDWSNLSCKKKPLDATFVPFHVPSDAKLMGQVYMGSSSSWGMGVLVNTWYGNLPNNGTYSTVFSEIGCIPMTTTTYSPESGWVTVSSFNWVLRKSNPKDYVPPFFCAKSQLEETETPDTIITALKSLAMKTKKKE